MFISANNLKEIREHYSKNLTFYSETEIKQIVKQLAIKRLNISSSEYILGDTILLSESDILFFNSALKRLKKKEPFQYVLGETEFYGLSINVDPRALIPRPETEELVDWLLACLDHKTHHKIADLCSGSGCIALAIKAHLNNSDVIALEKATNAIDLINDNMARTEIDIEVKEFDVLDESNYNSFEANSFSCWVSNPPYIPSSDKEGMDENVMDHEPHLALFVSDSDPIQFYRDISSKALVYLKESGYLFFEIHEQYSNEIINLLEELNFVNIELRKDLQGKPRMLRAQKSNFIP
jgi:release factor glutamine methyltransferase